MAYSVCLGTMATSGNRSPDALERIVDEATSAGLLPLDGDGTDDAHRAAADALGLGPGQNIGVDGGIQRPLLAPADGDGFDTLGDRSSAPPVVDLVGINARASTVAIRSGIQAKGDVQ